MTGRSKTDDYSFRKEGTSILGALSLLLTSLGVIIGAIPLPTVLSGTTVVIAIVVAWIGVIASLVIFARSAFAIASGMHSNRERILKRIVSTSTLWIEIFRPVDYDIGFIDRPGLNEYWTEMERLAQTVMGQDFAHGVLSKEKVQMHVDKNVQSVLGVFSKAMGNRSLVGFAIIIALKKGATQDIMEGKIRTGHDISDAHVSPNPLRAGSLYIAGIYAQGWRSRGAILSLLKLYAVERFQRSSTLKYIFGRAATRHGRRLLKKYGFQQINSHMEIWKLQKDSVLLSIGPRTDRMLLH